MKNEKTLLMLTENTAYEKLLKLFGSNENDVIEISGSTSSSQLCAAAFLCLSVFLMRDVTAI